MSREVKLIVLACRENEMVRLSVTEEFRPLTHE
jgi:hypothetical protein